MFYGKENMDINLKDGNVAFSVTKVEGVKKWKENKAPPSY